MNDRVIVKVPASTANMGPGFDTLGMALERYVWIDMAIAEETRVMPLGPLMEGTPADRSNLIYQAASALFEEADLPVPELDISIYSEIPLARGLGSSAAALVGAMMAANALAGHPFGHEELFQMVASQEGHPDNAGAALYGGIVVSGRDGEKAHAVRIVPPEALEVIVAIPEFLLETRKARMVLPEQVSLLDAVYNVSHASLLVAALCQGNLEMLRTAMKDRLHQPYRSPLVPGMAHILDRGTEHGALGVALSGAGPTMIAFVDGRAGNIPELERFLGESLRASGIKAEISRMKPSRTGAQLLTPNDRNSTLIETIKGEVRS